MNTKKITLKFMLTSIICLILIVMASAGMICLKTSTSKVSASSDRQEVKLTNADFNESIKTSYPYTPTGFNAASGNDSKKAGVINLNHTDYTNKFTNAKRGSNHDEYVLMLEGEGVVNYGFETSSNNNIEIKANSYYVITVDVYTENNSGVASVVLFDNEEEFISFKNINQHTSWGTYYFLISTNDVDSYKLSLGLYLNGSGTALFDNISIFKLNESAFKTELASAGTNYKYKSSNNNVVDSYKIVNGEYVNVSNSLDKIGIISHNLGEDSNVYSTYSTEANSDSSNNYAFKINNSNKTYAQYSTEEDSITFNKGLVYKVSVNAKVENLSSDGTAILQLVRTNAETEDKSAKDSSAISITSNTKSDDSITNNYLTYSFFVNADPTKDTTYKLVFGLGEKEKLTSGDLYISTLTISKIDYATFNSASDSTTTKLDLASHYAYSSTSDLPFLNNSNFDAFKIKDIEKPFPAEPTDWEVTKGTGNQLYGVINSANISSLDVHNLENLHIPTSKEDSNILMMYNENTDTLSYTSDSKELAANSYNKFQIDVNSQHAKVKVALVTTKNETEIELVSTVVETNINSFETVNLFIHNAGQKLNVALKLTLESNGFGYAYADQARFNFMLAPTEKEFNKVVPNAYNAKVDLSNLLLSENGKPTFFTETGSIDKMQVINHNNDSEIANFIATPNYESFKTGTTANEIIVVRANNETNYTLTSTLGYDVDESKYYCISVDVFTQNINSSIQDADLEKIGAGVKVTGYTNNFTAINTNDCWKTYKLYVDPNSSSTIYLEFSIGSEDNLTSGDAFFTNVKFEELTDMTEESFAKITEKDTVRVLAEEVKKEDTENETPKEETETKAPFNKSLLLYSISAILFGVAIVIAIVGVLVRKIKWKKPVKKSKNEYDRNKTISKQVYTRKATTAREAKLRELNKDLEIISEERIKFEEQYKLDLSKLRELKIKRAPSAEITKLEKEMKKNQKQSATLGLTANKIKADIEYAKTDAYLNALIKQMARESALQTTEKEEPEVQKTSTKSKKK